MSRPVQQGQPEGPKETKGASESPVATQVPSNGPTLPQAVSGWSIFIWIVSLAFLDTSFEDWTIKNALQNKLYSGLGGKDEVLKSHIDDLTLAELRSIDQLMTQSPDVTKHMIHFATKNQPRRLYFLLQYLASDKGPPMIKRIAQVPEQQPTQLGDLLQDTITSGQSTKGFDFEIRPLFAMNENTHVRNFEGRVEIYVTDQKTKAFRRFEIPLKMSTGTGFDVRLQLMQLSEALVAGLSDTESPDKTKTKTPYDDVLDEVKKRLSSNELPPSDNKQIVDATKRGNISFEGRTPFLAPAQKVEQAEIGKAQALLRGEKTDPPKIRVYLNDTGRTTDAFPQISYRVVRTIHNYLELTFNAQVDGKDLRFTARIPFQEGELTGQVIERIGSDGSLAKAMLQASSAFTRELVP